MILVSQSSLLLQRGVPPLFYWRRCFQFGNGLLNAMQAHRRRGGLQEGQGNGVLLGFAELFELRSGLLVLFQCGGKIGGDTGAAL